MKPSDVKDAIVDSLENIVNRVNYINHHHPEIDLSLDIDLVKDDLRVLYSKLELLKTMALPKHIFAKDYSKSQESNKSETIEQQPDVAHDVPAQEHSHSKENDDLHFGHRHEKTPDADHEQFGETSETVTTNITETNKEDQEAFAKTEKPSSEQSQIIKTDNITDSSESPETAESSEKADSAETADDSETADSAETADDSETADSAEKAYSIDSPGSDSESIAEAPGANKTDGDFEQQKHVEVKNTPETDEVNETNAAEETNNIETKKDLQYHQSGIEFSDNIAQPAETESSDPGYEQSESSEQDKAHFENDNDSKNKSNKSVFDLLSSHSRKTIGDQYVATDNSLNKRISANKEDRSIGAQMQQKPISDIKQVIGVNEKFLFINELFDGNIKEYHDAVARLNDMHGMQEAFDFLNELSEQYSWDASRSSATIEKLANYVQRRYL